MNMVGAFSISDLSFDGDRANQTVPTNTILIQGCSGWRMDRVRSRRAKGVGGTYGTGIMIRNGSNLSQLTSSAINDSYFVNNDGHGFASVKDAFLILSGNQAVANGLDGINIVDLSNPPPTAASDRAISLLGNYCMYNMGSGLSVGGYVDAYTPGGLPINGSGHATAYDVIISHNHLKGNKKYGLIYQSTNGNISHNHLTENGSDVTNGGALLNMTQSIYASNIHESNYFYGADAGGTTNSQFSGNYYANNGTSSGSGGCALNISAVQGVMVNGDQFYNNGDATGGVAINIRGFDGGLDPVFPTKTSQLSVKNCMITQLNNLTYGINASDGAKNIVLRGNEVYGGAPNRAYSIAATNITGEGNATWAGAFETSVVSAATTFFPDMADAITITGTAKVTNLYTFSRAYYDGKIERVDVGSGGIGYTPGAQIPITFSGGGGSGAAGYGIVNNAGAINGVTITSMGSGYTSNPTATPSIAPPSGTVTMVASINMNNSDGRKVRVFLPSAATLSTAGNMRPNSKFVGNGAKFIELIGMNGVWYELSRSA